MMKKVFSILFSVVFLVSHISLTIGTHYCGGQAVQNKILIGKTHLGCNISGMEEPCEKSAKTNDNGVSYNKVPCCENEYQAFQAANDFIEYVAPITFTNAFAAAFICTPLNLGTFPKTTNQFYSEYSSPPLEKDIQILFQTFLL